MTRRFRLEINSIEEFAAFCALIRGEVLEGDALEALAAKLRESSTALAAAEAADKKGRLKS